MILEDNRRRTTPMKRLVMIEAMTCREKGVHSDAIILNRCMNTIEMTTTTTTVIEIMTMKRIPSLKKVVMKMVWGRESLCVGE